MNLDAIYQAMSSLAQGVNSVGTSLSGLLTVFKGTPKASVVITSVPGIFIAPYPTGATPASGSSGNVAASTATASLAASSGHTTYIAGFHITSSGSTSAAIVNVTVAGVIGGTMTFNYGTAAGATTLNAPLVVDFPYPVAAFAVGAPITVSMPSLGAGNTNAAIVAYGFTI